MKFVGCMAKDPEMRVELKRIEGIVEDEFEQVDQADWA